MNVNLKNFILKLNESGIPLPLLRDNKTGNGSISYTLLVISATIVAVGLIGNYTKLIEINIQYAEYWFLACAGLYFGRNLTTNAVTKTVQADLKEKE